MDNWSVGVNAGAVTLSLTPLSLKDASRFRSWNIQTINSLVFGLEFQGMGYINTTPSKTAFDVLDVILLSKINLINLFASYRGKPRLFEIEAIAGMGWLHYYVNGKGDDNSWSTRLGLNLNFNLGETKSMDIGN